MEETRNMLRESLKWMLLTLLIVALAITGIVLLVSGIRSATEEDVQEPAQETVLHATPEPTHTNVPTLTPLPTYTPTMTAPPPTPTVPQLTAEAFVREWMQGMTAEEKVGQLAMFGFSGSQSVNENFRTLMQTYRVGNIILYGANIASGDSDGGFARCKRLTRALAEANPGSIPLLVSTDVEGGTVVRFRWSPWPSSGRTLGRRNDPDTAYTQFLTVGSKLRAVGINMDLAPVMDVAAEPMRTALKTRIISSSTEITSVIGASMIRGLRDASCLSVAKHFPGHGATTTDSHLETPVVHKTYAELTAYDLIPFAAAVEAGADAVLVAHILYPQLDEADIASMSYPIITGVLREKMGFDGIVMSDDFRMAGLTVRYGVGDAAVRFVLAGGDLILCGAQHDKQREIMDALLAAVQDGTISEARLDESVYRILLKKVAVTDWYQP